MTLTQLQIFALVMEMRGFTAAASRLGISQSAVSHALKALERELGVALISRRHAQPELTDIGRQLLQRARAILGLAETMRQEASDAKGLRRGTLRIGSFGPTSSMRLLPLILKPFHKAYPGIEVHIDEAPDLQIVQALEDRRIDLGFVVLPDDRFDTHALAEDQMVAVVPHEHPLAKRGAISLKELCEAPFILTGAGSGELVSRLFIAARLAPKIRYRSSQLLSTLETVARGDGVTIVAELSLPREGFRNCAVRPLDPPVRRRIGLAALSASEASPAAKVFIQTAMKLKRAGQLPGLNIAHEHKGRYWRSQLDEGA